MDFENYGPINPVGCNYGEIDVDIENYKVIDIHIEKYVGIDLDPENYAHHLLVDRSWKGTPIGVMGQGQKLNSILKSNSSLILSSVLKLNLQLNIRL